MDIQENIKNALAFYDQKKGFQRKYFSFLFGEESAAIEALRKLIPEQANTFEIFRCFVENVPEESQLSYEIFVRLIKSVPLAAHKSDLHRDGSYLPYYCDLFLIGLTTLHKAQLFTQKNFDAISAHADPKSIAKILTVLDESKILTQENFNAISAHADPESIAEVFIALNQAKTLGQFHFIISNSRDSNVLQALIDRISGKNVTGESFNAILTHPDPKALAKKLHELFNNPRIRFTIEKWFYLFNLIMQGKVEDIDFILVLHDAKASAVYDAMMALKRVQLLTLENAKALVVQKNKALLTTVVTLVLILENNSSRDISNSLWERIPTHLLTQVVFNELVVIAQQPDPAAALLRYVDRLLHIHQTEGALNAAQDVHAASAHQSVSTSAKKLHLTYKAKLANPDDMITEYKEFLFELPYTDSEKNDAKGQFIQGLYKIQRGYNLSVDNKDNGGEDKPISSQKQVKNSEGYDQYYKQTLYPFNYVLLT